MRMRRVPLMNNQRLWVKCKSCGKVIDSYPYYHEVCAPQPGDVVQVLRQGETEEVAQERVNAYVDHYAKQQKIHWFDKPGFADQSYIDSLNFDPRN